MYPLMYVLLFVFCIALLVLVLVLLYFLLMKNVNLQRSYWSRLIPNQKGVLYAFIYSLSFWKQSVSTREVFEFSFVYWVLWIG